MNRTLNCFERKMAGLFVLLVVYLLPNLAAQGQVENVRPAEVKNKVYVAQIWDDAILNDLRLIEILKKYKAKATFAVDAGNLTEERRTNAWPVKGTKFGKVSVSDIKSIYSEFNY